MCHDITEAENEALLKAMSLTRREMGVSAGASVALMMAGCASGEGVRRLPPRRRRDATEPTPRSLAGGCLWPRPTEAHKASSWLQRAAPISDPRAL